MGLLRRLDENIALNAKKIFPPKKGLISILIHGLFRNTTEANNSYLDPQQAITFDDFEKIIRFFLERDYEFLTQSDLTTRIQEGKNYCFLTFDDGYYNNVHSLNVLEKYDVPATFYCCTAHIQEQKSFWWDVLYRERKKNRFSIAKIQEDQSKLKSLKYDEIEKDLIQHFGKKSIKPINDVDRPFNEAELKDFSLHPKVQIGNHTHNHIILTNHSSEEIVDDIKESQDMLFQIIGYKPSTIAYPNGNFDRSQIATIKRLGLLAGLTVENGKNYLPIDAFSDEIFSLKRITPWHQNLEKTLELAETDFRIKNLIGRN